MCSQKTSNIAVIVCTVKRWCVQETSVALTVYSTQALLAFLFLSDFYNIAQSSTIHVLPCNSVNKKHLLL